MVPVQSSTTKTVIDVFVMNSFFYFRNLYNIGNLCTHQRRRLSCVNAAIYLLIVSANVEFTCTASCRSDTR